MKKFFLLWLATIILIGCQDKPEQRYFETSPEIESTLAGIKAYEAQDWDTWKANFADSAKIFHNTNKAASVDEMIEGFTNMLSNIESYGFNKENAVSEMVVDKDGKTWVNYWGSWKGTTKITGREIVVPVHLTLQYKDGKIINEYAYYDTHGINEAFAEIAKTQIDSTTVEEADTE